MLKTDLNRLKRRTKWSWERMCRELHKVMGEEGCSHTTLWRMANGKIKRPHKLVQRFIKEGINKVNLALSSK